MSGPPPRRSVDSLKIALPLGLGTRHLAAAAISRATACVAIVVFASSFVRVFDNREIIAEIVPELWIMGRESTHIRSPVIEREPQRKITVVTPEGDSASPPAGHVSDKA